MNGNDEDYTQICKSIIYFIFSYLIPLILVVLAGDSGVGKTHLLNRYVKGQTPKTIVPTIGVEFATKTVTLSNNEKIKAQIWDTAGQERYRAITFAHYRRAVGALLVYDVTKEKSFGNVLRWMEDLKNQADPNLVIMLVGNKIDICKDNPNLRQVSRDEGMRLASENKLLFEETSAIASTNVISAFERLLEEISKKEIPENSHKSVTLTPAHNGHKSFCKTC